MELREAIQTAKDLVADLFKSDRPTDIGLEELALDGDAWNVTVGFSRPWDRQQRGAARLAIEGAFGHASAPMNRTYKVVSLAKADGRLISISNREI